MNRRTGLWPDYRLGDNAGRLGPCDHKSAKFTRHPLDIMNTNATSGKKEIYEVVQ